ncbi:MAG: MEDS domain-containing protein [Candidatus Acidiferrales bacterium]
MNCKEITAKVTDYLEAALPAAERSQFEAHVAGCAGCRIYVEQTRQTVQLVGQLKETSVPAETKARLLAMFREHHAQPAEPEKRIRLGINDEYAAAGDHIGYFWESDQDFDRGVGFLAVGLTGRDTGFVFGFDEANDKVLASLRQRGLDVEGLIAAGRLQVLGGSESGEAMMAEIGGAFQKALAGGAPTLRLLGNLGWGRTHWPGDDAILEFEAKVTEAARQFPCVIVCMYDVHALSGRVLLKGGFQTHPLTVCDAELKKNPNYIPVERFLGTLRGSAGMDRVQ